MTTSKDEIQAQIAQLYKSLSQTDRALALQTLLNQPPASNSGVTLSSSSLKKRLLASPETPNQGGSRKVYLR